MQRGVLRGTQTAVVAVFLCFAPGAGAAQIEVTDTTDDLRSNGDSCSLREAVQAANEDVDFDGCERKGAGAKDEILLQPTTYAITRTGIEDFNAAGDFDVTGKTTIAVQGPGYARIDGGDIDRVLEIAEGGSLDASKLLITNGRVPGSGQPGSGGGGIRNLGKLTLRKVSLFDNQAQRAGTGCGCGGGIENRGRMSLDRVSISANSTTYDGGGILAGGSKQSIDRSSIEGNTSFDGAGIYVSSESLRITNSSISLNDAKGSSLESEGAGVYMATNNGEPVTIVNSTIFGNRAEESGGGLFRHSGDLRTNGVTITANTADLDMDDVGDGGGIDGGLFGDSDPDGFEFRNTIVAGNLDRTGASNLECLRVGGGFNSHNLLGAGGGCPAGNRDKETGNPKLGLFSDDGGPTFTVPLLPGSPAIGKAGADAPKLDQRGKKRDSKPDVGAYERR